MLISSMNTAIPVAARRVLRLSFSVALALAGAYGLGVPLPYLAPILAIVLTAPGKPPVGLKGLVGIVLLVWITCGTGLLMITVLTNYPVSGFMIVAVGVFMSNYLSVNKGKGAVGTFMIVGLTLITAAGMASFTAALLVVKALVKGVGLAVLSHGIAYSLFPEDPAPTGSTLAKPSADEGQSNWIAVRATLIVLPAYMLALINPSMYLPIIMKSVSLGQQGSTLNTREAGRELLGSTFLGGCLAILFWFVLGINTSLWMFFLWMLFFGLYFSSKLYGLFASRFPPSLWMNAAITMLILLGPAVEDSANGDDVYQAFTLRMSLFVAVTLYAWAAVFVLEHLRNRRSGPAVLSVPSAG